MTHKRSIKRKKIVKMNFDVSHKKIKSSVELTEKIESLKNEEFMKQIKLNLVKKIKQEDDVNITKEQKKENKRHRKWRILQNKFEEYKLKVPFPEFLTFEDVQSEDPMFLNKIKGLSRSVSVPKHWKGKKGFLRSTKFYNKKPYIIPKNIINTGLETVRRNLREKEENLNFKSKLREKLYPKAGKSVIEYQKLYDCFFKFQERPTLSIFGEIYSESRDLSRQMRNKIPGFLSKELRNALGMGENTPPPWLLNMQKFGLPPSYPELKIPGLNAPIPEGCFWGYQPSGWGRPLHNIEINQPEKEIKEENFVDFNFSEEESFEAQSSDEEFETKIVVDKTENIVQNIEEEKAVETVKELPKKKPARRIHF